jgi:aminoglycoside 6'-N-acetyltransferase I
MRAIALGICQLRHDYVEGTKTSPVGYLEGIYVREEYRRSGVAKELLECCEQWAKEKGCTEFASDCELTNEKSIAFHSAAGFSEANRIVCFTKTI